EKVQKHNLEMKLIDVEYTFDNNKIVFYFTSDGRVDFRELVKDLASVFKMRIDLRQIGVRDEAKMLDGIGNCGRSLCCSKWLSDFQPVSIKMAKTQGLSLNPTKISGICGRLMCCLKYENDVYLEMKKGMPDTGEIVDTPSGRALVVEANILENKIKGRLLIEGERDKYDKQKLGNEVFEFTKDEIKRLGKWNKNQKKNNEEIPEEIKALLKE
ncbi:MAG: regulatory iron-sulfur-containing complex subunit RicT, partial [Anaerovoracaceae bacterium]